MLHKKRGRMCRRTFCLICARPWLPDDVREYTAVANILDGWAGQI